MQDQIKLLNNTDYQLFGYICKPHGLNGFCKLWLEQDHYMDALGHVDHLLVEIEGLVVPFFLDPAHPVRETSDTPLVKFVDLDTKEAIADLRGAAVYINKKKLNTCTKPKDERDNWVGWSMSDLHQGHLGVITDVNHYSLNTLATVNINERSFMIPLAKEIIKKIDHAKQTIVVDCPEGLLDL